MAENNQATVIKTVPDPNLTTPLDGLKNMNPSCGRITHIEDGPPESTIDTVLEIEEHGGDGEKYNFTGPQACYAVRCNYRPLTMYQEVQFFAKMGTKEVLAILMDTIDGWAYLRSD